MIKRLLLLMCLCLAGCSSVNVQQYRTQQPTLDVRQFFTGHLEAWGIFQKRSGEVVKRFHVVMQGRSEGENLILHEDFTYSDGTQQTREWTLRPDGPNHWRGTAGDVVGEALGETSGNTLHWRYVLSLPVDGKVHDVTLDDWMYQLDDHTMANRSYMSKFGIEVGQISLFFRKLP